MESEKDEIKLIAPDWTYSKLVRRYIRWCIFFICVKSFGKQKQDIIYSFRHPLLPGTQWKGKN